MASASPTEKTGSTRTWRWAGTAPRPTAAADPPSTR